MEWGWVALGGAYLGIEFWLGKTDRVKPNSTLEVMLKGAQTLCGYLLARKF